MNGNGVAILVVSCDRYSDLWKPFFDCFAKYWPDCPFRKYLGCNNLDFEYPDLAVLKIGEDRSYSDNLVAMLDQIPEEWVICWVEDRIISGAVSTADVLALIRRAQQDGVSFLKLLPEHPLAYDVAGRDCGPVPPGTAYRVSFTVGLWRKSALRALVRPGETAWDLEKMGSKRSATSPCGYWALGLGFKSAPPIPHEHVIIRGKMMRSALEFLQREHIDLSRTRLLESPFSAARTLLYHSIFSVIRPMQFARLRRTVEQSGC